jgi:hypothetical protein
MISSATVVNYCGSVHDGGHLPIVFVGVMALMPLVWVTLWTLSSALGPQFT